MHRSIESEHSLRPVSNASVTLEPGNRADPARSRSCVAMYMSVAADRRVQSRRRGEAAEEREARRARREALVGRDLVTRRGTDVAAEFGVFFGDVLPREEEHRAGGGHRDELVGPAVGQIARPGFLAHVVVRAGGRREVEGRVGAFVGAPFVFRDDPEVVGQARLQVRRPSG